MVLTMVHLLMLKRAAENRRTVAKTGLLPVVNGRNRGRMKKALEITTRETPGVSVSDLGPSLFPEKE
ncbi:hypothetical protein SLE2022_009970 [Rubroshorea leprosula]